MARGPFVEPEYEQCVKMMEAHEDIELRLFTSSIFFEHNIIWVVE